MKLFTKGLKNEGDQRGLSCSQGNKSLDSHQNSFVFKLTDYPFTRKWFKYEVMEKVTNKGVSKTLGYIQELF